MDKIFMLSPKNTDTDIFKRVLNKLHILLKLLPEKGN